MTTPAAAQMLSIMLYHKRFFPYYVSNILAGLDEQGKGCIYSYDPIGHCEKTTYRAGGSAGALLQPLLDNQVYILIFIHVNSYTIGSVWKSHTIAITTFNFLDRLQKPRRHYSWTFDSRKSYSDLKRCFYFCSWERYIHRWWNNYQNYHQGWNTRLQFCSEKRLMGKESIYIHYICANKVIWVFYILLSFSFKHALKKLTRKPNHLFK